MLEFYMRPIWQSCVSIKRMMIINKRCKMKYLSYVFLLCAFFSNLHAEIETPALFLEDDWTHHNIKLSSGNDDLLLMTIDSKIFAKYGSDYIWLELNSLSNFQSYNTYKNYKDEVRFFKNNDSLIYVACNNVLYYFTPETLDVKPVYGAKKPIKSMIFEEDKIVIVQKDAFDVVNYNFETLEHHDFSSIYLDWYDDDFLLTNALSYARGFGFHYNLAMPEDMYMELQSFAAINNLDNLPEAEKILDTDARIRVVSNLSNNLLYVESGETWSQLESYIYDSKANRKLDLPADEFLLEESGDVFTISPSYGKKYTQYSTDRGQNWNTLDKYEFHDICGSKNGIIYGLNLETGLFAFDTKDNKWYPIDMPPLNTNPIEGEFGDFYELTNGRDIWGLLKNQGILKSTDYGKTWTKDTLPVENQFADAFFINENKQQYYLCNKGLYTRASFQDWELIYSDMPEYLIDDFRLFDANASEVLLAFKSNENFDLYKLYLNTGELENLNMPFTYMDKMSNGNYIFVSKNDQYTILEYNSNLKIEHRFNFDLDLEVIVAEIDSKNNLYLGTNKGVYNKASYSKEFSLMGNKEFPVENMIITETDYLFVNFESEERLYLVQANSDQIEAIETSNGWNHKELKYINSTNNIIFSNEENNTLTCSVMSNRPQLKLKIESPEFYYEGDDATISISLEDSDTEGFEVYLVNYSSLPNASLKTDGTTIEYKPDFKPYETLGFIIYGYKDDYIPFVSEFIEIETMPGIREVKIEPKYSTFFDTDETVNFTFDIETANPEDTKEGSITIQNALNNEIKTLDYDGVNTAAYEFYIPMDTPNGVYKIKYSGESKEYGKISEAYFYYIVHDTYFDSVEEPNSIITNTNVYPNPAVSNVEVQFEMKEAGDLTCEIYDLNGNKVLSIPTSGYAAGQSNLSFDVSNLVSGQYMIFLKAQDKVTAAKLVISK